MSKLFLRCGGAELLGRALRVEIGRVATGMVAGRSSAARCARQIKQALRSLGDFFGHFGHNFPAMVTHLST